MPYYGEKIHEQAFTDCAGGTEAEVCQGFDGVFALNHRWFRVLSEVPGWYVSARPRREIKQPRIDRILLPTRELMAEGWCLGPVGVELKRGGEKIGRAVCQALDYANAAFPISGGCTVYLEWVFIWPITSVTGDIASIMTQNRIGWASSWNGVEIVLKAGGGNVLRCNPDQVHSVSRPACGYKAGSR